MDHKALYSSIKKNSKKIMLGIVTLLSLILLFVFSRSKYDVEKDRYVKNLKQYSKNLDIKHRQDIYKRVMDSQVKIEKIDEEIDAVRSDKQAIESRRKKDEILKDISNDLRRAGY